MCGIWLATCGVYKKEYFDSFMKLKHRGPDSTVFRIGNNTIYGFHRLAINDLTPDGEQPLMKEGVNLLCNGEIYNYGLLKKSYGKKILSGSDCEVLIDAYKHYTNTQVSIAAIEDFVSSIDGEFAFMLHDTIENKYVIARDHVGVRPLFYGYSTKDDCYIFSSEAKGLLGIVDDIVEFLPGNFMIIDKKEHKKWLLNKYSPKTSLTGMDDTIDYNQKIDTLRTVITESVKKRLMSDRPIGFLLSGGLDSSIICAIAASLQQSINTFSIGVNKESPDLKAAREVSDFIKSNHTEILYSIEDGIAAIESVIRHTESYDCTTVRASVPMYKISEYIANNTNIRVLMSGEGADEVFGGYLYFRNAPTSKAFKEECERLVSNLYTFDIKRADRTTSSQGLELRVPFLDQSVLAAANLFSDDELFNKNGIEKRVLRLAFKDYLPETIINRQKDAFSDAVGYEWVDNCKLLGKDIDNIHKYDYNTPLTSEENYYRGIFNNLIGDKHSHLIPGIWRIKWSGGVLDPSARGLELHNAYDPSINSKIKNNI